MEIAMKPGTEPTDGELLERFVALGDSSAFGEIIRRHGGMVTSVCRRVLKNSQDVEDAFQAAFLVLARKAGSLRRSGPLANWLHTIAFRIALGMKSSAARRIMHERQGAAMARSEGSSEGTWERIRPALDEALSRLPEKYRSPIVLCYLEGKSTEGAARELGWPKGTVLTRLARAREKLRASLVRQGIAVTGAALAALIAENEASAAVSPAVVASTMKAAAGVAAGKGMGSGLVSAHVGALMRGGLKTMMWAKVKTAAAVMTISMAGAGGSLVAYRTLAEDSPQKPAAPLPKRDDRSKVPAEQFEKLRAAIKPRPGDFAWYEDIPWLTRIQEAREKAAAQGKPILIWRAADGQPCGMT